MNFTLISPDEFRLIKSYSSVFPDAPIQNVEQFLSDYYRSVHANNSFLTKHASQSLWSVSDGEITKQQIFFYAHWAGTRDMEIHFLKKGGKLTMLVDQESENQAKALGWNEFFSAFGDFRYIVAEDPLAVRHILRDIKQGRSIAISIDGNRGSASHFLELPMSPYLKYRFRLGGLKLALRTGLPITYISSFVEGDTARVNLATVFGEEPREIAAALLSLFAADLRKQPFAWKIWHRIHTDHHISPSPSGAWFAVGFEGEVYFGFTGNGKLVKLPSQAYTTTHGAHRDYVVIEYAHVIQNQIKAA